MADGAQLSDRERMRQEAGLEPAPAPERVMSDRDRMRLEAGLDGSPEPDRPVATPNREQSGGVNVAPAGDSSVEEGLEAVDRTLLERSARREVANTAALPGDVAGLWSLGRAGAEYLFADEGTTYESMLYTDEYRDLFNAVNNEELSDEARTRAANALQQAGTEALRPGVAAMIEWGEWGEDLADAQRGDEGEIPLDEEIGGAVLGTAVTLPLLPAKLAQGGARAASKGGRAALRRALGTVAEWATPLTIVRQGAGVGEIAATAGANATVALAMTELSRTLTDEDTMLQAITAPEHDPDGVNTEDFLGVGAVGTGALVAGVLTGRHQRARQGVASSIARNAGTNKIAEGRVDELAPGSLSEGIGDVAGGLVDESSIVPRALRNVDAPVAEIEDATALVRNAATQGEISFNNAFELGRYSIDGSVQATPVRVWRDGVRRLNATELDLFRSTAEAKDELTRRARKLPRSFSDDVTDKVLKDRVRLGEKNAKVKAMIDMTDDINKAMSKGRYADGVIDADQLAKELDGFYMRNIEADIADSAGKRVRTRGLFANRRGNTPGAEQQATAGGMAAKMDIDAVFAPGIRDQLRFVHENRARKSVLELAAGKKQKNADKLLVRRVADGQEGQGNVIEVRENGKVVKYEVGDQQLANALRFRPRAALPAFNEMRKYFQRFTTGNYNPLFSVISALYDHSSAMLGARVSRQVSGRLDRGLKDALQALGANDTVSNAVRTLLSPVVRTAELPINFAEGTLLGIRGRVLQHRAARMSQIAASTGNKLDVDKAERAFGEFMDSAYGKHLRSGAPVGAFSENLDDAATVLQTVNSRFSDNRLTRGYVGLLESVRDSARLSATARNASMVQDARAKQIARAKGYRSLRQMNDDDWAAASKIPDKDLRKIGSDVRSLGADVTRQSSSQTVNAAMSAIPYGNVIVQSTAHLLHHIRTNPAAWMTVSAIGTSKMLAVASMSPEARNYYETRIPAYQRTDRFWIQTGGYGDEPFDPDEHLVSFPIGPEMGFITSLFARVMEGMAISEGLLEDPQTTVRMNPASEFLQASSDLVGFTTPPLLNAVANLFGYGDINLAGPLAGRDFFRQPREDGSQEDMRGYGMNGGWITDRVTGIMNATMGTVGRALSETLEVMIDHPTGTLTPDAWDDAMDVLKYNAVEKQEIGRVIFPDAVIRKGRSSPVADEAYGLQRSLDRAADIARTVNPNISSTEDADLFAGVNFQLFVERLEDPILQQQAFLIRQYVNSPMLREDREAVSNIKKRIHRISGNVDAPVDEKNTELNELTAQLHDHMERFVVSWAEIEDAMRQRYNDPSWSIDRFLRHADRDLYD